MKTATTASKRRRTLAAVSLHYNYNTPCIDLQYVTFTVPLAAFTAMTILLCSQYVGFCGMHQVIVMLYNRMWPISSTLSESGLIAPSFQSLWMLR